SPRRGGSACRLHRGAASRTPASWIPARGVGKSGGGPRCAGSPANRTMAAMSTYAAPRPLDPERLASHMERLVRVARHLCGRHGDPEDLVQDTFERVPPPPRAVTRREAGH